MGFEKMVFAVRVERVKMPLESQVEMCLLIVPALDLVLRVHLRTTSRSWSVEVQPMDRLSAPLHRCSLVLVCCSFAEEMSQDSLLAAA